MIAAAALFLATQRQPKWLDLMLAGYVLDRDEKHGDVAIADPRTGYYLVRFAECDGADLSLVLTRDRKELTDMGYGVPGYRPAGVMDAEGHQPMTVKRLPTLTTGKGLSIGDSPAKVASVLGRPRKTSRDGSRKQFLIYSYEWVEKGRRGGSPAESLGETYTASYTFKEGKLIEIHMGRFLE